MFAKMVHNKKTGNKYMPMRETETEWTEFYLAELAKGIYGDALDIELIENPPEFLEVKRQATIKKGKKSRECCNEILEFVTGYNIERKLDDAGVEGMQERFLEIFSLLLSGRPYSALQLINVCIVDEIATQELKDGCIEIFKTYGMEIKGE